MHWKTIQKLPSWAFLLSVLAILIAVAAGIVFVQRSAAHAHHAQTDAESLIVRAATSTDHMIGNLSAPVQVIEYGDLSCSYCKLFYESTLPQLQSRYGNKIVVVSRNLPLPIHPDSFLEAQAAECVDMIEGEQSYWNYVKTIFAQPDYDQGLNLDRLVALAQSIGASGVRVRSCVHSGAADTRIKQDALEASIAGLAETPSFVLKSSSRSLTVAGDYPIQLRTGIDYLLSTTTNGI